MTRIRLQTFDSVVHSLDMATGDSLIVGRSPDREGSVAVKVPLPSVSGNHVLVAADRAATRVTDLGSKNGTWLKLPPNVAVDVPGVEELGIYLALPETRQRSDEFPEDASWSSADDFPRSIIYALELWFARCGVPAQVATSQRSSHNREPGHPGQIPLAVPVDIHVSPLQTTDARWSDVLSQVWRYVARQNDLFATEQELREDGIALASPLMRRVYHTVIDAARRGQRLLLMGASGVGKDMLARCYHRHSGRTGAFVARNCAMMSKEFLRAELFGAERGSFTGSVQRIVGAVERAHQGTLFLDEVGELATDVQAMLLRFLDSGEYERLGQFGAPARADVGIVCATNKDLRAACAAGEFRPDLWYRLSIQVVEVPSLRERHEDVLAYLSAYELRPGASALDVLGPDALDVIRKHPWDGNFRELSNFAARMPRDADRGSITAQRCLRLLADGSLTPMRSRAVAHSADPDAWAALASRAANAFREDHGDQVPQTWDDVKEYIEKYFKPLVFAHLGGVGTTADAMEARSLAERLAADRATAIKQLERYFDRFGR